MKFRIIVDKDGRVVPQYKKFLFGWRNYLKIPDVDFIFQAPSHFYHVEESLIDVRVVFSSKKVCKDFLLYEMKKIEERTNTKCEFVE